MRKTSKVRHLLNRDGRYWARLSVPAALRDIVGKSELLEPLGGDRKEALRKLPGAVGRMHDVLNAAREHARPAPRRLPVRPGKPMGERQMARVHYEDMLAQDLVERSAPPPKRAARPPLEEWEVPFQPYSYRNYDPSLFRPAYEVALRKVASGRFANDEAAATVGWILDGFDIQGVPIPEANTAEWRERMRILAGVHLETFKRRDERDEGNFNGKPTHPALIAPEPVPADPLLARNIGPDSDKPLSELVPTFVTERKGRAQNDYEYGVAIRMFEEHLGVESQQVVLRQTESADWDIITNAGMRSVPVVSMEPGR